MKHIVVVIDGGGRGAALVHKYSLNPEVMKIIAIPGNDLMQENVHVPVSIYPHLKTTSVREIIEICKKEHVTLVDVAQDNAVAVGLVDILLENGIPVFGPTKAAGEIEWNKAFSREFMQRVGITQPEYVIFQNQQDGIAYLNEQKDQPWFVKASGLAEGKGALPAIDNKDAIKKIKELQKFGEAGKTYLLEKWIKSTDGSNAEEFSAFALCDGHNFIVIGYAQDHKRVNDGDNGENTGGMGCSTPPLVITSRIQQQVESIFRKTVIGLAKEGRPYKGILYLGGILVNQKVYVIEFNARWGDPEAEVLLPGITDDYFQLIQKVISGELDTYVCKLDGKARIAVAATAKGYPVDYSGVKGKEIFGLDKVLTMQNIVVYGAGVKKTDGKYFVQGGRLFYIVGEGETVIQARDNVYNAMSKISIEGDNLHFRTDIGWRDVNRVQK